MVVKRIMVLQSRKSDPYVECIEENFLIQLFNTGRKCPKYLLWLESGQIPTRYIIYLQRLYYLQYLLQQDENSLLFKFFAAQVRNRKKGDWVSEVLQLFELLEIKITFSEIKSMNKHKYKIYIHDKVRKFAFDQLLSKQKMLSKGKNINYGNTLYTQAYLLPNNILSVADQQSIFSYRCRMNNLNYNFSNQKVIQYCVCNEQMTNEHLYNCNMLRKKNKSNSITYFPEYSNIFNGSIFDQKQILNILKQNIETYEEDPR